MNDVDKAIESIDKHIQAQVGVLSTGRGIITNAAGLNALIDAKDNLIAMQKPQAKAKPAKKEAVQEGSLTCEHCGATGLTKLTYGRWHGDRCKEKK